MAPVATRRKRVSKKNKKSWRKHTDINDIEAFLDEVRQEEIHGGPVSSKADEELFHIDTSATKRATLDEETRLLTKRERRQNPKPLKCFEVLTNTSSVKDPISKRNKRTAVKRLNVARVNQEKLKSLQKDLVALKDYNKSEQKRAEAKRAKENVTLDIWAQDDAPKLPADATWLRPQTLVHTVQNISKKIGKRPKRSNMKNSVLPAIEAPHPGLSYNPSLADHQELLHKVAEHECKLIKQEAHIERVTSQMYGRRRDRPTEATRLVEMSEGLPFLQQNNEVEEMNSDSEYQALNPPVQNRKKTLQKRRKLKEAHEEKLQREALKVEKKKISDIQRIRKLEEEMKKEASEIERLRGLREKMKQYRAVETKQMSRFKFEEPELEFNLPQDLRGNMRNVKCEGNMLYSHFKSLQKRNVIETRIRQRPKRKYKLKKITKASHKLDL